MPCMSLERPRFHLAFPVDDLEAARRFYVGVLGCAQGRESDAWIDFDFFGHQIVAHKVSPEQLQTLQQGNRVDGHDVPALHFGLVLPWDAFEPMAARLRAAEVEFIIEPCVRFKGRVGEQATLFVRDPAGHALEFKAFRDPGLLFARDLERYE